VHGVRRVAYTNARANARDRTKTRGETNILIIRFTLYEGCQRLAIDNVDSQHPKRMATMVSCSAERADDPGNCLCYNSIGPAPISPYLALSCSTRDMM